jgi:hypothetical protein
MMGKTVEQFIKNLQEFVPHENDNSLDLDKLLEGLEELENDVSVSSAMFELMEKYPEADFVAPGVLVHTIEDISGYEEGLIRSVKNVPMYLNVLMINRILNTNLSQRERDSYLELLKSVSKNPDATSDAKASAKDFLEYQKNRKI